MASLIGRVCAAYRLQIAQELGMSHSGLKTPRYLKITAAFSSFCSSSAMSYRNLHTATNRAHGQLSKLWLLATEPLATPAKRQGKQLTWRGSRALGGASREIVGAVQAGSLANCA